MISGQTLCMYFICEGSSEAMQPSKKEGSTLCLLPTLSTPTSSTEEWDDTVHILHHDMLRISQLNANCDCKNVLGTTIDWHFHLVVSHLIVSCNSSHTFWLCKLSAKASKMDRIFGLSEESRNSLSVQSLLNAF